MQHVCIRCNTKRSFPWHPDPPAFLVWAWSDDNCKHERLVQTISHILHKRFVCEEFPFHPKPLSPPTCFASSLFFSSAFFSTTSTSSSSSFTFSCSWPVVFFALIPRPRVGTFLPSGVSISCSWVDAHRLDDWYMPPYMKQCPWMHADKNRLDRANKLKIIINCTSNRLTSWALCAHFRMHIPHWKKSLPLEPCNAWCSWWHWDPIKAPAQLVLQLHSDDRLYVLDAFMPRPGR